MASDFSTKFTAAMPKFLERLAELIIYTTVAGSASTRTAIVNVSDDFSDVWRATFTMSSNATLGVASPEKGDRITYDSNVWTVVGVVPDYAGGHEIHAVLPRLTQ